MRFSSHLICRIRTTISIADFDFDFIDLSNYMCRQTDRSTDYYCRKWSECEKTTFKGIASGIKSPRKFANSIWLFVSEVARCELATFETMKCMCPQWQYRIMFSERIVLFRHSRLHDLMHSELFSVKLKSWSGEREHKWIPSTQTISTSILRPTGNGWQFVAQINCLVIITMAVRGHCRRRANVWSVFVSVGRSHRR